MSVQKIGQHVVREEDDRLLRGKGRYVSDMKLPGEVQAYVLRSPHAHAKITAIDTARAKAAPGVLAVLTGADIAKRGLGTTRPFAPRKQMSIGPVNARIRSYSGTGSWVSDRMVPNSYGTVVSDTGRA